jgi:hypothetical protein
MIKADTFPIKNKKEERISPFLLFEYVYGI